MAVWQRTVHILPNASLETTEEYVFKNEDLLHSLWQERDLKADDFIKHIDAFILRADWVRSKDFYYWKGDTRHYEDNDISLVLDKENGSVRSFYFRFDLRTSSIRFIEQMVAICTKYDLIVYLAPYGLVEANVSQFQEQMERSIFYKKKWPDYSGDQ